MPTYKVTDPQSGKTISITGDSPPSEQELNDIFSSVSQKPGVLESIGNFLLPETTQAIKGTATQGLGYLNQQSEEPMNNIQKGIGAGLSVLPGGRTATENTPLGAAHRELGANIVGGELIGQGINVASKFAKPLLTKIAKSSAGKASRKLVQKAVSKVTNLSGKEFMDFEIATQGKNLTDTAYKYLKMVDSKAKDKLRALYGKAGRGGILEIEMKKAEDIIQKKISNLGNEIVASTDDLLVPLNEMIEKVTKESVDEFGNVTRKALPGQEDVVSGFNKFSDLIKKEFGESGFTADDLLTMKRSGDTKYGSKVVQEDIGAAMNRAKKTITNKARAILKDKYPEIADALGIEQEIIHLKPIIKDQIGKVAADKNFISPDITQFHLGKPGTWVKPITDNKWVLDQMSQGNVPIPGLELGSKAVKKAVNSPLIQRGVITPQVVKSLDGGAGGGGKKPGIDIIPRYLYR